MYYQAISQCTQMLKNLESWLDKAEEYAGAKTFDVGVLLTGRLAPDMKPFIYQVQSACDYVKARRLGSPGRRRPSTRITGRRSMRCAPASGRPSPCRRAFRNRR